MNSRTSQVAGRPSGSLPTGRDAMMKTQPISAKSVQRKARLAGLLYVFVIVGGAFAEIFVRGRLVVHGDPAATARNILAHQLLYRMGFAVEVLYCACVVPLALIFYDLFKVVNKSIALLDVFFSLTGNTIESVSLLAHLAPILLLGGASYLRGFTPEQLQSAAYTSLQLFESGFAICLIFFGFDLLAVAYLILKSTFFPKVIGVLLAIEGVLYLVNSFADFLAPGFATRVLPLLKISAIAEVAFALWLLIRGVNVQRWMEQAGVAEEI
jgi:hypothetical protein